VLDKALAILQEFPSVRIEVSGHTDNVGKPEDNLALSQARADAVKAYLVGKGVAAERIVAKGYGDANPRADNKTRKGKAKNRRIEFNVLRGE
jgi:outer membrane protein OmpA-like peptidoglycan-associated protein